MAESLGNTPIECHSVGLTAQRSPSYVSFFGKFDFETLREAEASDKIIEVHHVCEKQKKKTRKPIPTQTVKYYFVMY